MESHWTSSSPPLQHISSESIKITAALFSVHWVKQKKKKNIITFAITKLWLGFVCFMCNILISHLLVYMERCKLAWMREVVVWVLHLLLYYLLEVIHKNESVALQGSHQLNYEKTESSTKQLKTLAFRSFFILYILAFYHNHSSHHVHVGICVVYFL